MTVHAFITKTDKHAQSLPEWVEKGSYGFDLSDNHTIPSLLSLPAKEGYSVYKSVPYGSVDETLPYLVRRAQENRTVLQGIRKERDLLRKELNRRLRLSLRGGS